MSCRVVSSNKARHRCSGQPWRQQQDEQEQEPAHKTARQEHPWLQVQVLRRHGAKDLASAVRLLPCTVVDALVPLHLMAHGRACMCPRMCTELYRIHRACGCVHVPVCLCVD